MLPVSLQVSRISSKYLLRYILEPLSGFSLFSCQCALLRHLFLAGCERKKRGGENIFLFFIHIPLFFFTLYIKNQKIFLEYILPLFWREQFAMMPE